MIKNTESAYGLIARLLHWGSALIVLGLLSVGFYMADIEFSPFKLELYGLHKSFGILILVLVFLRFAWKLANPKVKALESHQGWEKALAKIAHFLLYGAMIAMPLSGWLMSSAGGFPAAFFGYELPVLTGKDERLFDLSKEIHEILAFIIIGVVGLHMAGAFKHHFIDRDQTLQRMTLRKLGLLGGTFLALLMGALLAAPLTLVAMNALEPKGKAENSAVKADEAAGSEVSRPAPPKNLATWTINQESSAIKFEATQYGQPFSGQFETFDGTILFDPEELPASKAEITIDISSIKTGSEDRDEQARSDEWFDAVQFPQAVFVTKSFESLGANQYMAKADLTIRNVTIPVDFPFHLEISDSDEQGKQARMRADLVLKRLDFGIGQGQWQSAEAIGNEVKISVMVDATQN